MNSRVLTERARVREASLFDLNFKIRGATTATICCVRVKK